MIRRIFLSSLLLILLLALSTGCVSSSAARHAPVAQKVYRKADPSELFNALKKRNDQLSSLRAAAATLEYRKTDSSDGYTGVDLVMAIKKPGKIYARAKVSGVGTVFSMFSNGERGWVELDREEKVYTVAIQDRRVSMEATNEDIWKRFTPNILVEALLIDDLGIYGETVIETLPDYYIISLLDRRESGDLALFRRIWFERENLRVRRHNIYNVYGELMSEAYFSNYLEVEGLELPTTIRIEQRWEKLSIRLSLAEIGLNFELDDEFFDYDGAPTEYELIEIDK